MRIPGVKVCGECGSLVLWKLASKHVQLHGRLKIYEDALRALIHEAGMSDAVSRTSVEIEFEEMQP